MSTFSILDGQGNRLGELNEDSILGVQGDTIEVDRRGRAALSTALGSELMGTQFALQQGTRIFRDCVVVRCSSGATIEFMDQTS